MCVGESRCDRPQLDHYSEIMIGPATRSPCRPIRASSGEPEWIQVSNPAGDAGSDGHEAWTRWSIALGTPGSRSAEHHDDILGRRHREALSARLVAEFR